MEYLTKYWKTFAAIVYLGICIFDFIVMPSYLMYHFSHPARVKYFKEIEATWGDQPELLEKVITNRNEWSPFTLTGGGLFHLSFGAILTGAVLNGKRKKE